jgi:dsDNA-specific endonuclease/ATPase MutS2
VERYRHLSHGEILEIQLRYFHRFLDYAMEKRAMKVVVIHGVGSGRLREEIRAEVARFTNMECYDASYRVYGRGATEIRIWYGRIKN